MRMGYYFLVSLTESTAEKGYEPPIPRTSVWKLKPDQFKLEMRQRSKNLCVYI